MHANATHNDSRFTIIRRAEMAILVHNAANRRVRTCEFIDLLGTYQWELHNLETALETG